MARLSTSALELDGTERQIQLVVHHQCARHGNLEKGHRFAYALARSVHERERLEQRERLLVYACDEQLSIEALIPAACRRYETIQHSEAHVVRGVGVAC